MRIPPLPLYGREEKIARLRDLIEHVSGRGAALVIRGEAGIGKSALIALATARARERGLSVLTATGVQSEARFAFAGLHQLLRPLLGALDGLPGPQRRALEMAFGIRDVLDGKAPDVFLIALGALGLLTEAAATAPMLLVVDDAQWLDQPSCEVLGFIGRRLAVEPVILLVGVREGVPSPADAVGLPELHVTPLDEAAADDLLSSRTDDLPPDLRARLLREAAGNPLALIELPKALAGHDDPRWAAQDPLPLTARLEEVFAARLPGLPAGTRALLLLASLDDSGETRDLLAAAELMLTQHHLGAEDFHPAVAGGLGVVESGRFRFRHPLMRSAVQQAAAPAERRRGHAALAEVLAGQPDRSVWHRAAAADYPDEPVAADLAALARRVELRGGGDVAVAALELAASLGDKSHEGPRLTQAAWLALEVGRWDGSLRLARQAQRLPLAAYERTVVAYLLELLGDGWSGSDSIRSVLAVAEDLAAAGDKPRALRMIGMVSLRLYFANPDDETRRRAVAVAGRVTASRDDPFFLEILAYADPVSTGREVIDRLAELAPANMTDPDELMAAGGAASAAWADDLAVPFLREASEASRAAGHLAGLTNALALEAWAYLRRGDIRAAVTAAAEGARLAVETRQPRYLAVANAALAIAAGERGDPAAGELAAEAEAILLPMGANPMLALVEVARGRIALAGERFAEAYHHFARVFDPGDIAHHPFISGWALADITEAAVYAERDLSEVRGFLAEWEKTEAQTGAGHLRAQLSYVRPLLADEASAERRFAAALSETHGWPSYRARTQLAYGTWLRRRRRNAESRPPLREAVDAFTVLGSTRLAERAQRELRASGETVRRRQPEVWDQLTPQELQIAQLAADGLSNREIGERLYISHRTVGTHLYQLYPKLGVTSRTELRAVLEPR